jgi:hypothetical protein
MKLMGMGYTTAIFFWFFAVPFYTVLTAWMAAILWDGE